MLAAYKYLWLPDARKALRTLYLVELPCNIISSQMGQEAIDTVQQWPF